MMMMMMMMMMKQFRKDCARIENRKRLHLAYNETAKSVLEAADARVIFGLSRKIF